MTDRIAVALERIATALEIQAAAAMAGKTPAPKAAAPRASGAPRNFPNYGRSKGGPIAGASTEDLEYYANGARKTLADPAKAKWHDNERALLAAIEAEQAKGGGQSQEPPPHTDEDIPF